MTHRPEQLAQEPDRYPEDEVPEPGEITPTEETPMTIADLPEVDFLVAPPAAGSEEPERLAEAAETALRDFAAGTTCSLRWEDPVLAHRAIEHLAHLARLLPQAIEQAAAPIREAHDDGRLIFDGDRERGRRLVAVVSGVAGGAATTAARAAEALDDLVAETHRMGLDRLTPTPHLSKPATYHLP